VNTVGAWYLHLNSHNPEQASGGVAHLGPYQVEPWITVTYPNSSSTVLRREKCVVQWTATSIAKKAKVRIELHNGDTLWVLAPSVSNKGEWKWKVGNWYREYKSQPGYPNGDNYFIRIVLLADEFVFGDSDLFSIGGPPASPADETPDDSK
jgi:hypothetical protein